MRSITTETFRKITRKTPAKFVKKQHLQRLMLTKIFKKSLKILQKFLFEKIDVVKVLSKYEIDCQLET